MKKSEPSTAGKVRTKEPDRAQGWLFKQMPDQLVAPEHPVRVVAAAVEALDLSGFLSEAKAVEGHPGRPVTSPRLLLALWVYGIQQGVGTATELARRCEEDRAFEWLAGGVTVSHDRLSQFRVEHLEVLQQVFTDVVSVLLQQGLVSLEQVAQDGTRVRASASAPSFRRESALGECREQAELHLEAVLAQKDDPELTRGQQATREAKARDYQARVDAALEAIKQQQARKKGADKDKGWRAIYRLPFRPLDTSLQAVPGAGGARHPPGAPQRPAGGRARRRQDVRAARPAPASAQASSLTRPSTSVRVNSR